jgi:dTDP-4-dehydrorhamnose reductase
MKVLVLGSNGQLGKKIIEKAPEWAEVFSFSHAQLDIKSESSLKEVFKHNQFDVLINCAAYTQVDKAESESDEAFRINRDAMEVISRLCKEFDVFLVHFSTDYVFSGTDSIPYNESSNISPLGVYGLSKAQGEIKIQANDCSYVIIRTSWLYSESGKNFLRTIAGRLVSQSLVKVVSDQIGSPTYVGDLADASWTLLSNPLNLKMKEVFHFSNEGVGSWYDFAFEIGCMLGKEDLVSPIKTEEYSSIAPRPHYSVLDKTKIKKSLGKPIRHWKAALKECILKYKELENL